MMRVAGWLWSPIFFVSLNCLLSVSGGIAGLASLTGSASGQHFPIVPSFVHLLHICDRVLGISGWWIHQFFASLLQITGNEGGSMGAMMVTTTGRKQTCFVPVTCLSCCGNFGSLEIQTSSMTPFTCKTSKADTVFTFVKSVPLLDCF